MLNILFVDDEPNILSGLQRMLRTQRKEWDMAFAPGGNEALAMLAEKKYDVIVSDMKMPGMDGAQLLQEVSSKFPQIVRIILSGFSEKEMIMRSLSAAHQYLAKPCDAEILIATITRACALRNILCDDKLRRLVAQMRIVPSLPHLYQELLTELNKPDPSMKIIGGIIEQDIGMTAKILQITNSAFFGLSRSVSSTSEAVTFLGLETITTLALGVGIFSQFDCPKQQSIIDELWTHSFQVGVLAKKIAASVNRECANDAFAGGLLHDIGEVVFAANMPDEYMTVRESILADGDQDGAIEVAVLGATNAAMGAYLIGLWGLPNQVVEAVAFHHHPGQYETMTFNALTAVHLANPMIRNSASELSAHAEKYFDIEYLKRIEMYGMLPQWIEKFAMN